MNRLEWFFTLIDQVTGPARRISMALQTIQRGLGDLGKYSEATETSLGQTIKSIDGVSHALRRINAHPIHIVGAKFDEARHRVERFRATLVGLIAGGMAVGGTALLGRSIIGGVANIEQQRIALETLIGEPNKARTFLKEIMNFADTTPFDTPEVLNAVKRALGMGFNTDETLQYLKTLGNAAAGSGARLEDLVLIFGQIRAAGRVATEDLNQLAERGIRVWDYLAQALGKTTGEVRKLVEQGAIDAVTGLKALTEGMDKTYANMMIKQSETVLGRLSTLRSRPTTIFFELDKAGALKPFNDFLFNLVELTDFSKDPGKRIKDQLVSGLGSLFNTVFTRLANLTKPERVSDVLNNILSGIQRFVDTIFKIVPVVQSGLEGFVSGFTTLFNGIAKVWGFVQNILKGFGMSVSQNPEEVGRFLGYIVGLIVGWKMLNVLTFGATGLLNNFLLTGLTRLPVLSRLIGGLGGQILGVGVAAISSITPVTVIVLALGAALVMLIRNWDGVRATALRVWNVLKVGIEFVNNLMGAFLRLPQVILNTLNKLAGGVGEALKKAKNTALDTIHNLFSRLVPSIMEGLKAGLNVKNLGELGKTLGSAFVNAFKRLLGIRSPSRAFIYMGRMSAIGLAMGLLSGGPLVAQAAEAVSEKAITAALIGRPPVEFPTTSNIKLPKILPKKVAPSNVIGAIQTPVRISSHKEPSLGGITIKPPRRVTEKEVRAYPQPIRERKSITVNVYVNINGAQKNPETLGAEVARILERHLTDILERAAMEEGHGLA